MNEKDNTTCRVALFGGAFDPPHIGHTAMCAALAEDPSFDEVWVLPNYRHPFGKGMASFEDRLAMCRLAFVHLGSKVKIRDDEAHVGGGGYTIDLIRYMVDIYPDYEFTLALGADNYGQRHRWKEFQEIHELVRVKFFGRKGWKDETEKLGINAPFPEVSSQEIREAIGGGSMPSELMPKAVADYVSLHRLYFGEKK